MLEAPARTGVRGEDIGLEAYLTATPPLGGRLKARIDDFRVEERGLDLPPDPAGPYTAARIRLTNWETHRFVQEAAGRLNISRKKIHFSGTKDKRGVTEQTFTFDATPPAVAMLGELSGVEVVETFRTSRELELGRHRENAFQVVVRGIPGPPETVNEAIRATWNELVLRGGAPNYFGPQRFGSWRATTHRVGERIVRGDFLGAVRTYLAQPHPREAHEAAPARLHLLEQGDWKGALAQAGPEQGFERALLHRLVETGGDAVAALQALPTNLQWLFVSAYQSFLFNRILSRRLQAGFPPSRALAGDLVAAVEDGEVGEEWVPVSSGNLERVNEELARGRAVVTGLLPGTEVPMAEGPMGQIEQAVLREAAVSARDFLVPEKLEWSSRGTRRALVVRASDFSWQTGADELEPGHAKAALAFRLPKGSYATTLLREFIKSPWQDDYA